MGKLLNVSTRHVSSQLTDWLNRQCLINATSFLTRQPGHYPVASHGQGWFVVCDPSQYDDEGPPELVSLVRWFVANRVWLVNFDQDHELHPELPVCS